MQKMSVLFSILAATAVVAPAAPPLAVGDLAPEFTAVASDGTTNRLTDFRGRWVVLYFYPRSFTPGCTTEACSLRDGFKPIQDLGAVILGVSLDTIEKQARFREEYHLPFVVLSDADKTVSRAYHNLALGGFFARRRTFVINPQGRIAHIFETVKPAEHARDILAALKALQAGTTPADPHAHR